MEMLLALQLALRRVSPRPSWVGPRRLCLCRHSRCTGLHAAKMLYKLAEIYSNLI